MPVITQATPFFRQGVPGKLGFIALTFLDLWLTLLATQIGMSELNPFVDRLLARPEDLFLVKGVAPALIALVVPGKFLVPAIGFLVAVAGWNIAQLATVLYPPPIRPKPCYRGRRIIVVRVRGAT